MFAVIRSIFMWLGQFLLTYAVDASSRAVLAKAIKLAEESNQKGAAKMQIALKYLRIDGTEYLKNAAESKLRWLIESKLQ